MFKIEGERGLFTIFEPSAKGDLVVSHGDTSIQCFLHDDKIKKEDCKDVPNFIAYTGCGVQYIEDYIGWNPSWESNKRGAA